MVPSGPKPVELGRPSFCATWSSATNRTLLATASSWISQSGSISSKSCFDQLYSLGFRISPEMTKSASMGVLLSRLARWASALRNGYCW